MPVNHVNMPNRAAQPLYSAKAQTLDVQTVEQKYNKIPGRDYVFWVLSNLSKADDATLYLMIEKLLSPRQMPCRLEFLPDIFSNQNLLSKSKAWNENQIMTLVGLCTSNTGYRSQLAMAKLFLSPEIVDKVSHLPLKEKAPLLYLASNLDSHGAPHIIANLDLSKLITTKESCQLCSDRSVNVDTIAKVLVSTASLIKNRKLGKQESRPFFANSNLYRISQSSSVSAKLAYLSVLPALNLQMKDVSIFGKAEATKEFASLSDPHQRIDAAYYLTNIGQNDLVRKLIIPKDYIKSLDPASLKLLSRVRLIETLFLLKAPKEHIGLFLDSSFLATLNDDWYLNSKQVIAKIFTKRPELARQWNRFNPKMQLTLDSLIAATSSGSSGGFHFNENALSEAEGHSDPVAKGQNSASNTNIDRTDDVKTLREILGPRSSWADLVDSDDEELEQIVAQPAQPAQQAQPAQPAQQAQPAQPALNPRPRWADIEDESPRSDLDLSQFGFRV